MVSFQQEHYDVIDEGCRKSAEALVPRLVHDLNLSDTGELLVDVGCGRGHWASKFQEYGLSTYGLDGHERPDWAGYQRVDLEQPGSLVDLAGFTVALCLEVAEHLSPDRAESFIEELCGLAPFTIFSAAIPRQGGIGHLNEQWPAYWADLFEQNGRMVTGAYRYRIWDDPRIENWYRQNLLIVATEEEIVQRGLAPLFREYTTEPLPLVHPVLWDHRVR